LFPKTVFSRLATAVRRKTKRTEPRKPPMMVKSGDDVRIGLAICIPLNVNTDKTDDTTNDALSFNKTIFR
jgi:hypothetical protein